LHALFPAGSVTGAPKIRAMEIINELEDGPRGVYTGAIGYLCPDGGAQFSVAIRTAAIGAGRGEIGIGSGVVADSNADAEFDECLLKLRFLTEPPLTEFELIETLLWNPGEGYVLLERHLARLMGSASYFGFELDEGEVKQALARGAQMFRRGNWRVRLTANRLGKVSVTSTALPETANLSFRFAIAEERVNSSNLFLYHKTTERDFLDRTRNAYRERTGCDEVIFLNERDELTEGSFTTLFAEIGGKLLTPALSCGLLPGTLRDEMLETGQATEAILTIAGLRSASRIWLGNSVRGLVPAQPIES
jgi:para-aminobenzoate synthetase / 4-amino-4-deoxychorismate lyase